jgi:hypothetical protein
MPDRRDPELTPHHSVAEYFHDVVSEAMRNQGVATSAHAEFYLVNLLAEYSHVTTWEPDQPLALQLAEAREAAPAARLRKLRAIGDHSLYVTGFFGDSLARKLVDSDYYISIGCTAYRSLAGEVTASPLSETYRELSGKFPELVEVLAEVSTQAQAVGDRALLKLYERYLRTGSKWLARRLRGMGMSGLVEAPADKGRGGNGGGASA